MANLANLVTRQKSGIYRRIKKQYLQALTWASTRGARIKPSRPFTANSICARFSATSNAERITDQRATDAGGVFQVFFTLRYPIIKV